MENRFSCMTVPVMRPFAALMLVLVATSLGACSSKTDSDAQTASVTPSNVTLTPAQRQNIHLYTVAQSRFHRTIDASGAVDFDNDQATSVIAAFSGPVSKLLVNPGDKVKKGDALAIVDSADFATAVSTYRKALTTARTNRRLADLEKDLVQHRGVAQREEDQAQTDAANADADAEAALQGLLALNVDAKTIADIRQGRSVSKVQSVIRAPIGGTVVEKLITPGQLLQAGTTACFTIADLSRVWVMAQVSASDMASVHVGDPADVETGIDGKTLAGTVTNIASLVSPDTRLVAARVEVPNPGALLKKQMYVNVRIHSRQEDNGLLVPVAAVLRDDENLPFVYLSQHDGSFARRRVTLGYRGGDQYDIVDGLRAGDQVVTDGGIFVQFMQNQ
jgi:cobalt-zinc-cadmium efflux system membrane fusion protein